MLADIQENAENALVDVGSRPPSHHQPFSGASACRQVPLCTQHRALPYTYYVKLPVPQSPKEDCSSINPVLNVIKSVSKQPQRSGKPYSGQQRRECPVGWPSTDNSQQLPGGSRREREGPGSTGRGRGSAMEGGQGPPSPRSWVEEWTPTWGQAGARRGSRGKGVGECTGTNSISLQLLFCSVHSNISLNTEQKTQLGKSV